MQLPVGFCPRGCLERKFTFIFSQLFSHKKCKKYSISSLNPYHKCPFNFSSAKSMASDLSLGPCQPPPPSIGPSRGQGCTGSQLQKSLRCAPGIPECRHLTSLLTWPPARPCRLQPAPTHTPLKGPRLHREPTSEVIEMCPWHTRMETSDNFAHMATCKAL